jgi:hypothetical protein
MLWFSRTFHITYSIQLLFKIWSWVCETKIILTFFSWVQCVFFTVIMSSVVLKMEMSYVCVCVYIYIYIYIYIYLLLSSPLTRNPFKYRHSADHCGQLIMMPNSKTFRDKCWGLCADGFFPAIASHYEFTYKGVFFLMNFCMKDSFLGLVF